MSETLQQLFIRRAATQRATLQPVDYSDGTRGMLRSRYSAYDNRWRVWLLALDGEVIAGPIRLVPGVNLLQGFQYDVRVPGGHVFTFSLTREPPNKETMDVDAVVYYRNPDQVEALG